MLSSQFFKREKFQQVQDLVYEGYTCKYPQSTLILYSKKTGNALASFVIQPKNTNNGLNWSVLTARPPPQQKIKCLADETVFFQGLFNQDNQEIQMTISNLSPLKDGFVVFNILHADPKTNQVEQVNLINELYPNQSYTIPCDKRTSTSMILKGLIQPKEEGSKIQEKVSVEKTEKENGGVTSGLYFSLNVQPNSSCSELCDEFSLGTKWECSSHFVRVYKNTHPFNQSVRLDNEYWGQSNSFQSNSHFLSNDSDEEDDGDIGNENLETSSEIKISFQMAKPNQSRNQRQSLEKTKLKSSIKRSLNESINNSVINDMVQTSQAGKLDHGQTKMDEYSVLSTRSFNPELASSPTVLSLSILPFNFIIQPHDASDNLKELNALFDEFIKTSGKTLIEKLIQIYYSETCVIDLTQKPDTVIIQCGHACFHHSNINKSVMKTCPLCRKNILALVRMDNQALL